jgi:ABC-type glycerol-3-phosphate transport system substrate-binding protein
MKKILLIAAALVLAGCGEKKAVAPAAEGGMAAPADTSMTTPMTKSDTTMARDSAK